MISRQSVGPSPQKAYPQDIQCVYDPVDNKGGIFISNLQAAQNPNTLRRHNIKAVITAANGARLAHSHSDLPFYKYVPGQDHQSFNLARYFQGCMEFMKVNLERTNVLVHCMAGVSRSVTIVLAYLIKEKAMGFDHAYTLVKNRRRIIQPNQGFITQLKQFERQLRMLNRQSASPTKVNPHTLYRTPESKSRNISYERLNTLTQLAPKSQQRDPQIDRKIAQIRKKYSRCSIDLSNSTKSSYATIKRVRTPVSTDCSPIWEDMKASYLYRLKTTERDEGDNSIVKKMFADNDTLGMSMTKKVSCYEPTKASMGLPLRRQYTMNCNDRSYIASGGKY